MKTLAKKEIEKLSVRQNISVRQAMKHMDNTGKKVLFIVDEGKALLGTLTDGDIRRWILSGGSLDEEIGRFYNRKPTCLGKNYDIEQAKRVMLTRKLEWIPVINNQRQIHDVLLWDNIFGAEISWPKKKLNIPVVIMAGGKGTRLDPLTRILPKALIPIGEKPVIEVIMGKFSEYGVKAFYIAVSHKANMIETYFKDANTQYTINYLVEKKPLGTAGGLKGLENKIKGSFIVINCDVIIDTNYAEIAGFHRKNNYDITIVSSYRHHVIPYGICKIENGGVLKEIREKPEYDFLVNAGMYFIKADVLKMIPEGKYFLMTDLIEKVTGNGGKVGVYPVTEKSWVDIGQVEEYFNALHSFR